MSGALCCMWCFVSGKFPGRKQIRVRWCKMAKFRGIWGRIESELEPRRWSMTKLAEEAGVASSGLSRVRHEEVAAPRTVAALARALGVRPEWLGTGEGPRKPPALDEPSEQDLRIVQLFRQMPTSTQAIIVDLMADIAVRAKQGEGTPK